MAHLPTRLAVWAVVCLLCTRVALTCPDVCTCRDEGDGQGMIVTCWYRHLVKIPDTISRQTSSLDLRGNNLTVVKARAYRDEDFPLLHSIYLDDNGVHTIEPEAFYDMKRLRMLSLRRNKISVLKRGSFMNIWGGQFCKSMGPKSRDICVIDLTGNNILLIESGAFQALSDISVYVGIQSVTLLMRNHIFQNDSRLNRVEIRDIPLLRLDRSGSTFTGVNVKHLELADLSTSNIPPGTFRFMSSENIWMKNVSLSGLQRSSLSTAQTSLAGEDSSFFFDLCRIDKLPTGVFFGSPIHNITFRACEISDIQHQAFSGLGSLKILHIEGGLPDAPDMVISQNAFDRLTSVDWLVIKNFTLELAPFALSGLADMSGGIRISHCNIEVLTENALHFPSLHNISLLLMDNTDVGAVHENAFGNATAETGLARVEIRSSQNPESVCGIIQMTNVLERHNAIRWDVSWAVHHNPDSADGAIDYNYKSLHCDSSARQTAAYVTLVFLIQIAFLSFVIFT